MSCIYGLYDPRVQPRTIRYVGYTAKSVEDRLASHVHETRRKGRHTHKLHWMRSLIRDGVKPEAVIIEFVPKSDWQRAEKFWIQNFGGQLVNETVGGEGLTSPSERVKDAISKKVSASLQGNSRRTGIPHTEEHKIRISRALLESEAFRKAHVARRGKPANLSAEGRKRISEVSSRQKSDATRAKISAASKGNKGATGLCWINDGTETRLVRKEGLVLPIGFVFGRPDALRAKVSVSHIGMKPSDETRAKMSAAGKGKPKSAAHVAAIAATRARAKLLKEH
jgi:hypothetical protein